MKIQILQCGYCSPSWSNNTFPFPFQILKCSNVKHLLYAVEASKLLPFGYKQNEYLITYMPQLTIINHNSWLQIPICFSSSWNRLNRGKDSIMYSLLVPMLSEPSIFLEDYHGFWWSTVHSDSSQNSFIFSITSGQYLHGQLTVFRCNSQLASLGRPDSFAFQIKSGWSDLPAQWQFFQVCITQ